MPSSSRICSPVVVPVYSLRRSATILSIRIPSLLIHTLLALARIHRRTALGTALEEASGCSSESGIIGFGTETRPETRSTQ